MSLNNTYDVIVIGAGHAGCEAALAAARMGCSTLMLTMNLDSIALMSCNPAIGGLAKGHLVKEIDALGGEMAKIIDRTGIQFRTLNRSKGPAVHGTRAQADKQRYRLAMKEAVEKQPGLDVKQGTVEKLLVEDDRVIGVETDYRRAVPVICGDRDNRHVPEGADPHRPGALSIRQGRGVPVPWTFGQLEGARLRDRTAQDRHTRAAEWKNDRFFTYENAAWR